MADLKFQRAKGESKDRETIRFDSVRTERGARVGMFRQSSPAPPLGKEGGFFGGVGPRAEAAGLVLVSGHSSGVRICGPIRLR